MWRFRVHTELKLGGTRNAYLETRAGAARHILAALQDAAVFRVTLYDRQRPAHGGFIGQIGGVTTARQDVTAMARALASQAIADVAGIPVEEWQTDIWIVDQVLTRWDELVSTMRRPRLRGPDVAAMARILGLSPERLLWGVRSPYGQKHLVSEETAAPAGCYIQPKPAVLAALRHPAGRIVLGD